MEIDNYTCKLYKSTKLIITLDKHSLTEQYEKEDIILNKSTISILPEFSNKISVFLDAYNSNIIASYVTNLYSISII